jgi:hypothetical protein
MPKTKKGPHEAPNITIRKRNTKMLRIHLAHVLVQSCVSDSGLDSRTAISEIKNMPGESTTTAVFSSAAPITIITPATNGQVTKAITGCFHPRYM